MNLMGLSGMLKLNDLPLREVKKAKTKLELLRVLEEKLKNRPLELINITELCKDVMISEVTFYNYFKKKTDLILYHNKLLEIEIWLTLSGLPLNYTGLQVIGHIFEIISDKAEDNMLLMREFLLVMVNSRGPPIVPQITTAEIIMKFPNLNKIPPPDISIPLMIVENIEKAIKNEDLKHDIHIPTVLNAIITILIGLPFALLFSGRIKKPKDLRNSFKYQLKLLWKGLNS
jgi:hypothetical protein